MNIKQYVVIGDYTSKVFTCPLRAEKYAADMSLIEGGAWYIQEVL